jgi:hypothetical protein
VLPLSEDEERILQEIAQQLYEDDPAFARGVGGTTLYTHTVRRMKWSAFGFLLGLVLLVVMLATSYQLAFGGFLVMLACALAFERNARKLGRAGMDQLTKTMRSRGARSPFGDASKRMRERFRRDDS